MNSRVGRYVRFLITCCALFIALPAQASSSSMTCTSRRDPIVLVAEMLHREESREPSVEEHDEHDERDEQVARSTVAPTAPQTTRRHARAPVDDRALIARKYLRYCALLC